MGEAFTVPTPRPLPAQREGTHWYAEVDGKRVRLSNLDKVFWPKEGYTKGDLLSYYFNVAGLILPYLRDRPLTMKRMPHGIAGPHFYEKNAPSHTPDWVPRCKVGNLEVPAESNDYLMACDLASLLFVVNLGCVQLDPLHSRCRTVDVPDYLFFDLDPFEPATFDDVIAVALHVRAALGALDLTAYPKISGATGMQIYVPLSHTVSYERARTFVETIGRAIVRNDPGRVTMRWQVSQRAGKVFIDHNMNRRGANIASAYSVRPEPGATVAAPVTWEEVERGDIRPSQFTIATVHERFASMPDPMAGLLAEPIDLRPVLEKLGLDAGEAGRASAPGMLAEYERKRRFDATPEPGPSRGAAGGNRFVIQKHNATRLHYDLRLERDGVLVSWAVPKGLPTKHGVRHLAVQTEDHPLEYRSFEGWIPQGNYGAGEVVIYDRGTYETVQWDPGRKVSVRLHGERHRGEWHLVKTTTDWLILLAKASAGTDEMPQMRPMLAERWPAPFDDPAWRFEPKLDGIRTLAYVTPSGTRLVSRSGRDQTSIYPELSSLAQFVNASQALVDGEIVTTDESGRPSFELLQKRMNLTSAPDIHSMLRKVPVVFYAFDLLWLDGSDLTSEPLERRRELLEQAVTSSERLRLTTFSDGSGTTFAEAVSGLGWEGTIAKKLGSPYVPGKRTRYWRKIKVAQTRDCVVLGWLPGQGSRSSTFGALVLGAFENGKLVWIGQVGTGFSQESLERVTARLAELETGDPPVDEQVPGARWVRPELVCEVEYLEMTRGRKLRAPSFKGLRPDIDPRDVLL